MKRFFSIGGLAISLECETGPHRMDLGSALEAFACEPCAKPDLSFRVDVESPFPRLDDYATIFTTRPDGLWTILEDAERTHYLIALQNGERDREPYKIVRADRLFTDFLVHMRPSGDGRLHPLEHPLPDLAVSGHININRIGVILHAACVSTGGRGLLFSGVSGAGKSALSELWQADPLAIVLTDERVLVREQAGDLWAYGTPWHGTSVIHKNLGVPIERVFFIKHGKENRALPLSRRDAANRLMVRCFPTFWNKDGMQFALGFCARVAENKSCAELAFVKDPSAVAFARSLAAHGS
jgi:hypothetical protein